MLVYALLFSAWKFLNVFVNVGSFHGKTDFGLATWHACWCIKIMVVLALVCQIYPQNWKEPE